jgi:hypothetical protein
MPDGRTVLDYVLEIAHNRQRFAEHEKRSNG